MVGGIRNAESVVLKKYLQFVIKSYYETTSEGEIIRNL
jgi:hypothetical protein